MNEVDINEKINGLISNSIEKFFVKNYNDAIRDLKAAEVLDKNNPEILYNLGVNYSKLGLFKTSITYFDRLLNLSNTFVEILTVKKIMAYSLIRNGQFDNAIDLLNSVIKLAPDDITAISMKGYCLEKQKNYFEAVKVYKIVIERDKKNFNAYNSLAYIYAVTDGDLQMALKYAQTAFESNKISPAYLDTMGYIYLKLKKINIAGEYLAKALSLNRFSIEIKEHIKELKSIK